MKAYRNFVAWLDDRTGIRDLVRVALFEAVPGGARWRYVWGSTLVLAFFTQLVTGAFLWMNYAPSGQTAWESVCYVQHEMQGGWLLRGIHHYTAQAMVVLLAFHLLQVVIDGAYRAPREVNFLLGVVLMMLVLGLSLTGYLLPWDQKGYWATKVATNLMGLVPVVGASLQRLVMGGPDYGHHTLTRFFALHAGVLPGLLTFFLVLHVALFRRHGLHSKKPHRRPDESFWPDQILKDAVASLIVLAVVLGLAVYFKPELGAPADGASPYSAARPEWYFLFLFQFLKYFPGRLEVIGALVVPGVVMAVLFVMPFVGRWKLGHRFNVVFTISLLLGALLLSAQAWHDDHYAQYHTLDPSKFADNAEAQAEYEAPFKASQQYLDAKADAEKQAERAVELVQIFRIPPEGALTLLRNDPKIAGAKLFKRHCAGCHNFAAHDDQTPTRDPIINPNPSAPNLYGFGSRAWVAGLLDPKQITGVHYFGYTKRNDAGETIKSEFSKGDTESMVGFVKDEIGGVADDQKKAATADIQKIIAALSAQAQLPAQAKQDEKDKALIAAGEKLITEGLDWADYGCTDCHKFHDAGDLGSAPDLTGYGSRGWLIDFVSNPAQERFYGKKNDRMPTFRAHAAGEGQNLLSQHDLELIVDWLRGQWPELPEPADETP